VDTDTQVMDADKFYAELGAGLDAIAAEYEEPDVQPAPLSELVNWRNARGAVFYRQADGTIWVSHEDSSLSSALRSTIRANQETLGMFLPTYSTVV
jgi:hypothetical protein